MFRISIVFSFILTLSILNAQNTTTPNNYLGNYEVGFCDTIIYDSLFNYHEFDYSGSAPLFVQIWHPLTKKSNSNYLRFSDFRNRSIPLNLKEVYNHLQKQIDTSFIEYNLTKTVEFDTIDWNTPPQSLLQSIYNYQTNSLYYKVGLNLPFPVIIYHHGAGGFSDENYLLCEILASKGYVVLSSNFHWPYLGKSYGSGHVPISARRRLIDFAENITTNRHIYFIGHSWGAQSGFILLHGEPRISGFISLETTMEAWNLDEVPKYWPDVDSVITNYHNDYDLPIAMFAKNGRHEAYPFSYFDKIDNTTVHEIIPKNMIRHDGFYSTYYSRLFLETHDNFSDRSKLNDMHDTYMDVVSVITFLLDNGWQKDLSAFEDNFFIKTRHTME